MSKEDFIGYLTLGYIKHTLIINTIVGNSIIDPLNKNDNVQNFLYNEIYFPIKFGNTKYN